ncbi:MAG: NADH-quinone oxidoreductase subunit C [Coriobacteriia bacterium]
MTNEELKDRIHAAIPDLTLGESADAADVIVSVDASGLHAVVAKLQGVGFDQLEMVTAVDRGEQFELVYILHSLGMKAAVWVKSFVPRDAAKIASVTDLYSGANWPEREVFDLFGIEFDGHPDMRRIMLPLDFVGSPLRKDYTDPNIIPRPDYI